MNRVEKKKQVEAILTHLIDKYGFILYDIDGLGTDLMRYIKEIIKLK